MEQINWIDRNKSAFGVSSFVLFIETYERTWIYERVIKINYGYCGKDYSIKFLKYPIYHAETTSWKAIKYAPSNKYKNLNYWCDLREFILLFRAKFFTRIVVQVELLEKLFTLNIKIDSFSFQRLKQLSGNLWPAFMFVGGKGFNFLCIFTKLSCIL